MFSQEKSRIPDPIVFSRQDTKKQIEYYKLNIEYSRNSIYDKKRSQNLRIECEIKTAKKYAQHMDINPPAYRSNKIFHISKSILQP